VLLITVLLDVSVFYVLKIDFDWARTSQSGF